MKLRCLLLLVSCASLTPRVEADTLVAAGSTLTVTNTEAFGLNNLQLGAGSTLVFGGAGVGAGGLNEYTRTGAGGIGTPFVNSYGTWTRITTNVFWGSTTITNATSTEYVYTGRWFVPGASIYSFFEHIDDAAIIAVDGNVVLQNSVWNDPSCVRNVSLAAGWHDLEVRIYNGASTGGMATNVLASGILYSPSNTSISVANQAFAFPFVDTGDGSSLLSVHNCILFQKAFINDSAAFDLSAYGTGQPLALTAGLLPAPNAKASLTVAGGCGELTFGAKNLSAQFPPFNADVAFTGVSNPKGVTFHDYSTVVSWPASCPWRVADGSTVALFGTNLLGAGDVTLTNYNIYVLSPFAVARDAVIHVQGTNLTAYLKPCTLDTNGLWSGWNITLTNDVSLEGVNATASFPINVDIGYQGTISGTGTVTKTGTGRTEIKEPCTFVGPVSISDTGTFIIDASTAGDSNNVVTVGAGSTLSLYPTGYGTTDTTASIKTLHGGGATGKIFLPAKQTLTVDYLDGALTVQGSGSALRVNTLGTNATLIVSGQTAVTLGSVAPGTSLSFDSGASLRVLTSGATLDALTLVSGTIPVSGNFAIGFLGGAGKLVKQGSDTLSVYFATNAAGIQVDAGKVTLAPPASGTVLGSLPALWLDASASNVFTQYKSYTYTNNSMVIERWNDCRPGAPNYGYNNRGDDYCQAYPFVLTNALNGLPVVSFGSYQMPIYPPYVKPGDLSGTEARRLPLSTNIAAQYAVFVFGSQNGGGATVLSGDTLYRPGSTTNDFRNPATPILAVTGYPVWTNGVPVIATNTGFTGGYQILSINANGNSLNALGWRVNNATAGGQIYGEALFFTNSLTAIQRMTAESYLATKWRLPYSFTTVSAVTVASGATLEVGGAFSVGRVYGSGTLSVTTNLTAFDVLGAFNGSIALSGGALSIPNLPAPPAAADVPTNALTAWFDPSVTNRVVFGAKYTPARPLAVAALFDRTTTNRFLFGSCNTDLTYDRRPWLAVTNNPLGETLYWLDYTNSYSGDVSGNTLRLYRNSAYIGLNNATGNQTPTNVQTAFIVLDSSRGGGVPITYNVDANQVFTRDNPLSTTSPIWGANTTNSVKNGQTFLDGVSVNGAARGYSGTTELLSFVATNVVQAAFFGWYGNETSNRERLGEILLFETALTDSARAGVEAYLMRKWLGKARAGYSDVSGATLTGSGTVTAAKISQLPVLGAGFTGDVALTDSAFAFTVSTNAARQYVVAPSLIAPAALTVPAAGTISVTFLVKPAVGTYTLLSYGSADGTGFSGWTLSASGALPSGPVRLQAAPTALKVNVISQGSLIRIQ